MKKQLLTAIMVLIVVMLAIPVLAQTTTKVTIDLNDLPPDVAAQVMAAKKLAEEGPLPETTAMERAEEWAVFGEKFGQVIASVCKELNIAVNDFIATDVGKLTAAMIIWKVLGRELWDIFGGGIIWLVITMILWRSFRFFHMNQRIKDKKTGETTYISRYDFENGSYAMASGITHASIFVVFTIVCMVIIF